jgi:HlyD family secretion protein
VNNPLFTLDQTLETAAVAEAEQGLHRAENHFANITKGLRPSEIQAIEAKLEQAKATYNLTKIEYKRREQLLEQKVIAKEVLDRTRTEMERGTAAVAQLNAELETAQLGARPDEVKTARAEIEAARQRLTQARWSLDQKKQTAPQNGRVFDTFYVEGEFIPAAHPVVSILPPGNIKIRFFVPEDRLASLEIGQKVFVQVDGTGKIYQAAASYISPQAEYTPPVIYSRESRSKLVFMVEATLTDTDASIFHPGQPADVSLEMPNA